MTARPTGRRLLTVAASVLLLAGCPGADGLTGTVTAVSDVEGLPDLPVPDGQVVAVPAASADDLWTAAGLPAPRDDQLRHASAQLPHGAVEQVGGVVGAVDDGRFDLPAVTAEHLLCLLQDDGPGEHVTGCAHVELPASGRLEVTTGEAGLRAQVER